MSPSSKRSTQTFGSANMQRGSCQSFQRMMEHLFEVLGVALLLVAVRWAVVLAVAVVRVVDDVVAELVAVAVDEDDVGGVVVSVVAVVTVAAVAVAVGVAEQEL